MSREKQIEEIANAIYDDPNAYDTYWRSHCERLAETLYNAGYRKQSVSFWGVAKVYNEYLMCHQLRTVCGLCGYELGYEGCCVKSNFCPNCGAKMSKGDSNEN